MPAQRNSQSITEGNEQKLTDMQKEVDKSLTLKEG